MRRKPHPARHVLLADGVKIVTFCKDADLDYENTRRALNGETRPSRELAERVAQHLGLPVSVLFREEELR